MHLLPVSTQTPQDLLFSMSGASLRRENSHLGRFLEPCAHKKKGGQRKLIVAARGERGARWLRKQKHKPCMKPCLLIYNKQ